MTVNESALAGAMRFLRGSIVKGSLVEGGIPYARKDIFKMVS